MLIVGQALAAQIVVPIEVFNQTKSEVRTLDL